MKNKMSIAFGPVPSRRLGRSLGINNIPPKNCSYSCIYCQIGRTRLTSIDRKAFYKSDKIVKSVKDKITEAKLKGEVIDYLTFVPDGEPTLDINLGKEIELLRPLGIKIAVITNSSLIWDPQVRNALLKANWVSLKIDANSEKVWRRINRAYKSLQLEAILEGILEFANIYKGELATETMLIQNINNDKNELEKIAEFISKLNPNYSYISIPTRPPAEKWGIAPRENEVNLAYQIFKEKIDTVEYLIGYEGNAFAYTGNVKEDLLSITSVHPMREDAVKEFLKKAKADWSIIDKLLVEEKIVKLIHLGKNFYMRKFPKIQK